MKITLRDREVLTHSYPMTFLSPIAKSIPFKSIPTFLRKYEDVTDKGLFWEMVKMEIRATTIVFAKRKAKQKRDEEKELLQQFSNLQDQKALLGHDCFFKR